MWVNIMFSVVSRKLSTRIKYKVFVIWSQNLKIQLQGFSSALQKTLCTCCESLISSLERRQLCTWLIWHLHRVASAVSWNWVNFHTLILIPKMTKQFIVPSSRVEICGKPPSICPQWKIHSSTLINIAISALDGFQLSGHREFTFFNPLNFKMDRIFLVKIEHFSHKIPKSIITNEEILEKLQISPDKSSVSKVQKVVLSLNSYVSKSRVIGNELITQVPVLIFRRDYWLW